MQGRSTPSENFWQQWPAFCCVCVRCARLSTSHVHYLIFTVSGMGAIPFTDQENRYLQRLNELFRFRQLVAAEPRVRQCLRVWICALSFTLYWLPRFLTMGSVSEIYWYTQENERTYWKITVLEKYEIQEYTNYITCTQQEKLEKQEFTFPERMPRKWQKCNDSLIFN